MQLIFRTIIGCIDKIIIFLNFEWTRMSWSLGNQTRKPYFSQWTISYQTSFNQPLLSSDGSNTILSNIDRTRTSYFEHRTNSNMFICWWSNSNTLFLASNDRTSNFEPNTVFTTFTKLLIELTWTSFSRTSNELERVHLIVIELKHPIFGFERSNFELRTLFDPSLSIIAQYLWRTYLE